MDKVLLARWNNCPYTLATGLGLGIVTHIYGTLVTKESEDLLGPSVLGIRLVIAVIF